MADMKLAVKITGDGKDLKAEIEGINRKLDGFSSKAESSGKRAITAFGKITGDGKALKAEIEGAKGTLDKMGNAGAKAGAEIAKGMKDAQKATLTWNQFTGQRMAAYMKDLGSHKAAIQQISKEWKVYKASGVNALNAMDGVAKETASTAKKSADKMGKAYETLGIKSIRSVGQEISKVRAAYQRLADSGRLSKTQLARANAAMKNQIANIGKEAKTTAPLLQSLSSNMGGFVAAYAGFSGVKSLAAVADKFTNVNARLKLASKSTEDFKNAQIELSRIAREGRADWGSTVDVYSSMALATQDLGTSQNDLLQVTQAINESAVVSGSQGASQEAAIMQLRQGLASGTLRGEELNSVLEQSPRLARMIADGAGIAFGDLKKVASEGKLTSEVVIQAILNQSEAVHKEFKTMPVTIGQATTVISGSFTQWIGKMDETTGVSSSLASGLMFVGDNINLVARGAMAGAVAWIAYSTASKAALAGNTKLTKSAGILGAAFVGWQIGSYLSDEFSIVRQAGIAMAAGLSNVWEHIKYGVKGMGATIVAAYDGFINTIKENFAGMVAMVSRGMKSLGMAGDTTANMDSFVLSLKLGGDAAGDLTKKLSALGAERDKNIKQNDAVYGQMFVAQKDKPKASSVIKADFGNKPQAQIKTGETDKQKAARLAKEEAQNNKIINLAQAKFDRLANMEVTAIMGEEDRTIQKYDAKLLALETEKNILVEHHAWTTEQKTLFAKAEKAIEAQKQDDLNAIHQRGLDKYDKLSLASAQVQAKTGISLLQSLTASAATESRAMFNINKAASLASATVSGVEAVQHSYKAGAAIGGPIVGAAFAGVAVAATLANLKKIQSTTFGGGGEAGTAGGAAAIPSQALNTGAAVSETAPAQQAAKPTVNVYIQGNVMEQTFVNDVVIPTIQDQITNYDLVLTAPDSANATVLAAA